MLTAGYFDYLNALLQEEKKPADIKTGLRGMVTSPQPLADLLLFASLACDDVPMP